MSLWVPPGVQEKYAEEQKEYKATLDTMIEAKGKIDDFNRDLKQIDPYLELVRAKPNTNHGQLKPGYWHVLRHNPGNPPSVFPVEGPDGEFREPGSWLFDELRKRDLWRDEAVRDRDRRDRKAQEAKERRKNREHEERVEEMQLRMRAAWSPGVSFSDVPWTYRKPNK